MERYNPFASSQQPTGAEGRPPLGLRRQTSSSSIKRRELGEPTPLSDKPQQDPSTPAEANPLEQSSFATSRQYTTSFPDPFGQQEAHEVGAQPLTKSQAWPAAPAQPLPRAPPSAPSQPTNNRSNSITFMHQVGTSTDPSSSEHPIQRGGRQASGGFSSFLSRATSVTSSSMTDRVSGAMDSLLSAVDSLGGTQQGSEQAAATGQQQASAASYLASKFSAAAQSSGSASGAGGQVATICRQRVVLILDGPGTGTDWAQQFTQYRRLVSGLAPTQSSALAFTSFFASQFSSSSSSSSAANAANQEGGDLIEQVNFNDVSVLANQSSSTAAVYVNGRSAAMNALAAIASGGSSSSSSLPINRLAMNLVNAAASSASSSSQQLNQQQQQQQLLQQQQAKIVRPEYVVVRQRGREHLEHLKAIVMALDYCMVPMFEPYEVWSIFQDRQLIFAKLLRVQRQLGKENFPLIPQIFCQTHQDLLNYINNSQVTLPCMVRTGPLGKGKIRIDNLQMLKDFATIMATSGQSCTIEQYLEVKCDLIVQRLGTSLKLFKGNFARRGSLTTSSYVGRSAGEPIASSDSSDIFGQQQHRQSCTQTAQAPNVAQDSTAPYVRQAAPSRQTSLGSGVLSSLMSATTNAVSGASSSAQPPRRTSNPPVYGPGNFEKLSEVNTRYRRWVEAITSEFDNKIDVFCVKIVVASNDREYIVGLRNCSMEFLGPLENQDEDRRSFVELIMSKMNTALDNKHQPVSREPSTGLVGALDQKHANQVDGDTNANTNTTRPNPPTKANTLPIGARMGIGSGEAPADKTRTFMSQTDIGSGSGGSHAAGLRYGASQESPPAGAAHASSGHLANNRSRSVSINQTPDLSMRTQSQTTITNNMRQGNSQTRYQVGPRRGSERSDSQFAQGDKFSLNESLASSNSATVGSTAYARQASLGQSFLDSTSTALSSFQRQSLSFLRRLDSRTGADLANSSTPPLSAKSDNIQFERSFSGGVSAATGSGSALLNGSHHNSPASGRETTPNPLKSQSVDVTPSQGVHHSAPTAQNPPPKPPRPSALANRQSSLANYSSSAPGQQRATMTSQRRCDSSTTAYGSGRPMTPQNSLAQSSFSDSSESQLTAASQCAAAPQPPQRVIRQNSALSAFEPYDPTLRSEIYRQQDETLSDQQQRRGQMSTSLDQVTSRHGSGSAPVPVGGLTNRQVAGTKYDTVSVKSATSNTSDETTTAEDTMNNLKRTFASIFGDKCE